ncbi:amidohydrolase family protein [Ensifer adhaerens]|uniref:amidohydrolase family protein n=2 Tax=Ensifer TaxID=106591 RepID=UPI000B7DEFBF|nr:MULTISPECIES: amidohydrolase family protein [Ensifer]MBD9624368.1 amidohydrolase family protein [Ensifer sp. ENS06]MBW0368620.1 amidohydrolase [Ensifer adhaerens]UCM23160.1 amidohydrolase [Ensifer adhaerens]UTV39715.1 amidohydrolase [Ensifer adhaerens]
MFARLFEGVSQQEGMMGVDWAGPVAAVTRRNVLRLFSAGVMANVLSGCRHDWPPAAACELPYPIVDVHCHFFNAADVPVEGLVRYVALREKLPEAKLSADPLQSKRLENALVVFLVTALGDVAPKAKAEDAILKKRVPRPSDAEFERQKDEQLRIAVKQLVALAGEQRASLTARSGAETPDYQGLLEQIGGTPGLPQGLQRRSGSVEETDVDALASAAKAHEQIGNYLSFVRLMQDYRENLAETYARIFASKCRFSMITPSILDFEKSIGGRASPQHDQIDVMDEIQQLVIKRHGIHMHSFVGFDPHREAQKRGSSLENVRYAIMEKGFIGVKIYPPMGFKAWGNADPAIDAALKRLYDWCRDNSVPIMAHAENSIGAGCGYGNMASPAYWKKLLDTNRYNDLRINLAHFGAFDEVIRPGAPTGVMVSCAQDKFSGPPTWEDIIGKTIGHGRRPNLFADLSYLSELVTDNTPGLHEKIRALLDKWLRDYDPDARHLMFGTDWSMMALEKDYNAYVPRIAQQLKEANVSEEDQQNIFWKNASRYLGLDRPGPTRQRLATYCRKRGLDASWLSQLEIA